MSVAWKLMRKDSLLGVLWEETQDQPFFGYRFEPTPAFDDVKPLFDEELALLNENRLSEEDWGVAYEKIDALGLTLVSLDGNKLLDDFLLHIEGDRAWFRY
jgi:hypothetical protein